MVPPPIHHITSDVCEWGQARLRIPTRSQDRVEKPNGGIDFLRTNSQEGADESFEQKPLLRGVRYELSRSDFTCVVHRLCKGTYVCSQEGNPKRAVATSIHAMHCWTSAQRLAAPPACGLSHVRARRPPRGNQKKMAVSSPEARIGKACWIGRLLHPG